MSLVTILDRMEHAIVAHRRELRVDEHRAETRGKLLDAASIRFRGTETGWSAVIVGLRFYFDRAFDRMRSQSGRWSLRLGEQRVGTYRSRRAAAGAACVLVGRAREILAAQDAAHALLAPLTDDERAELDARAEPEADTAPSLTRSLVERMAAVIVALRNQLATPADAHDRADVYTRDRAAATAAADHILAEAQAADVYAPGYVAPTYQTATCYDCSTNEALAGKWSGAGELPAIGQRVYDRLVESWATVIGYRIEHGYTGLWLRTERPVELPAEPGREVSRIFAFGVDLDERRERRDYLTRQVSAFRCWADLMSAMAGRQHAGQRRYVPTVYADQGVCQAALRRELIAEGLPVYPPAGRYESDGVEAAEAAE